MKKASIIGNFGTATSRISGQIIKTKIIADELERKYGADRIRRYNTHGAVKALLASFGVAHQAFQDSENVIILPAQNGLKVIAPLCAMQKRKHPSVKLHYVVIGGWLPALLKRHRYLQAHLRCFDGIYVETSTMKLAMEELGFANIAVLPNCKDLKILSEDELVYSTVEPLKLCTFSRVMKEKGIEDAVRAVRAVNETLGRTVYTLDIYGSIAQGQEQWFEELKKTFSDSIRYQGVAAYDESVRMIRQCFALLFPTHFYTEGIPGTILDAYAAGVPVIASKWESFGDLIEDGVTGLGYPFGEEEELTSILKRLAEDPQMLTELKKNCLARAHGYTPEAAIGVLLQRMGA